MYHHRLYFCTIPCVISRYFPEFQTRCDIKILPVIQFYFVTNPKFFRVPSHEYHNVSNIHHSLINRKINRDKKKTLKKLKEIKYRFSEKKINNTNKKFIELICCLYLHNIIFSMIILCLKLKKITTFAKSY